jgi:rhomboid protease GluP
MEPFAEVLVRVAGSPREASDLSLVLASQAIPCRLWPSETGIWLLVPLTFEVSAKAAVGAYEREQEELQREAPIALANKSSLLGWWVALALALIYVGAGPGAQHRWAFIAGEADLSRILAGQWWRLITALTLHLDFAHLLGNLATTVILVSAVADLVGGGMALFAILLTGLFGNALVALAAAPPHISVGFSTSLFGALGMLAIGAWSTTSLKRRWLRFGGALALLAMLGVGERSDVMAHAFGFASGVAFGWATRAWSGSAVAKNPWLSALGYALSVAIVALSWGLAAAHRV